MSSLILKRTLVFCQLEIKGSFAFISSVSLAPSSFNSSYNLDTFFKHPFNCSINKNYFQDWSFTEMLFLNSQVPDKILIDRCVGRRVDPVTGKIYHLKFFPPENEEIKARLVTRSDDTEEKV